tara:strand:+ start:8443 stop:9849 length:1407 start_codon:yes stop_codon:yes gene_type:complete
MKISIPLSCLVLAVFSFAVVQVSSAADISLSKPPTNLVAGKTYKVSVDYDSPGPGIAQVQLFDSEWKVVATQWVAVAQTKGSETISVQIPSSAGASADNLWQAVLYDDAWSKLSEDFQYKISIGSTTSEESNPSDVPSEPATSVEPARSSVSAGSVEPSGSGGLQGDWMPEGDWTLEWSDEFTGTGSPEHWYPMLGYTPEEFGQNDAKGLRWNGSTEESAQMYSTMTGNHWLNGDGQLVIRAVTDKESSNDNGPKVETAYLQTGYPAAWDSSEPTNVRWEGTFFSPAEGSLYIAAKVRSDQVVGHSTWFAFWLFSQTRSYNGNSSDGTEVDIIEIAKGAPNYMSRSFNVANHWSQSGGSESKQFSAGTDPSSLSYVDVTDSDYHVYGIEWTPESMKCFVDGKLYYTFTTEIPSNPVDMMLLLTMEFQKDAWDPNQGDGRTSGPYVSDTKEMREMSRALIDYVRVYRKQ